MAEQQATVLQIVVQNKRRANPNKPPPSDQGFTNDWIRRLRAEPGQRWEYGDGDSGRQPHLRLRHAGTTDTKTWGMWVGKKGEREFVTLGYVNLGLPVPTGPLLTVAQAAAGAARLWEAYKTGTFTPALAAWRKDHPLTVAPTPAAPSEGLRTVRAAYAEFLALRIEHGQKKRRRPEEVKRDFENVILPKIGDYACTATRELEAACKALITEMAERAPCRATHMLRLLQQFFAWCRRTGWLTDAQSEKRPSPVEDLRADDLGGEEAEERKRWLTDREIWILWHGLETPSVPYRGLDPVTVHALRLLLVIPTRSGALVKAERSEINRERRVWSIPPDHLKLTTAGLARAEGRPLDIPLSDMAMEGIDALIAAGGESRWLVPTPMKRVRGDKRMDDKTLCKAVRRLMARGALELPGNPECPKYGGHFTPHDLRRTCRTLFSRLRQDRQVAERCLGHVERGGKIVRTYDRWAFAEEMRSALDALSDHIRRVVSAPSADAAEEAGKLSDKPAPK